MFYRTRLDWLWQWRCRYNADTTRVTFIRSSRSPTTWHNFFFFSFFFIYSCKSSSEAICLRRKQVEQKERTKENEKYGDTIDNNLSCDLRAEAYRETREVAPPQGSHSPGNNREKKRDQRGCMRCMDGIKNNLHGVNNILHLTTILL